MSLRGALLLVACPTLPTTALLAQPGPAAQAAANAPEIANALASLDAPGLAAWVATSGDAQGLPYLIVDKAEARVFAFGPHGKPLGHSSVLLGLGKGDISPPGIGTRKLADIPPADRITPAGRFEASPGRNLAGADILWIDYDAAVSMHAVVSGKAKERRLQRLATPTPLDNRISYGCINVPVKFYDSVIRPLFAGGASIVYILPDAPRRL